MFCFRWSTHWFQLEIEIPDNMKGEEVHLLWNSNSETLVWHGGNPIQGLSGDYDRISFPLSKILAKNKTRSVSKTTGPHFTACK